MAELSLVLRDAGGALGVVSSAMGVHLGDSDDLVSIALDETEKLAASSVGIEPRRFAISRFLASRGAQLLGVSLQEASSSAEAFASKLRESSASLPEPKRRGSVRGRGDVLSGESEILELTLDERVEGLRYLPLESIVDEWTRGTRLPSLALSTWLSNTRDLRDSGLVVESWEVAPAVRMIPVRTPTIFPATHTNAFILGTDRLLIVEPASPYPDEIERLALAIEELKRNGGAVVEGILLTHHHPDHVGGAMALRERLEAPILAHERTAMRLEGQVKVDRLHGHGDALRIGELELELIHTPGHAPGHLCVFEKRSGALLAGDMVAGVGTILVEPYDGDMQLYLDSLAHLRAHGSSMILPAHGGVVRDPNAWLTYYIQHRLAREAKIVEALKGFSAPTTIEELVPVAYADTSPTAWPLARMASAAHLEKLVREGRATQQGERFALV